VVAAALTAIYWVSDRPVTIRIGVRVSDKVLHGSGYAVLAALWLAALRATWPRAGWAGHAWCAAVGAAAYGATDEWHQSFVDGRTADVWDWAADAGGATAVAVVVTLWVMWRRRRPGPASRPADAAPARRC
jgi:VanZ family protein